MPLVEAGFFHFNLQKCLKYQLRIQIKLWNVLKYLNSRIIKATLILFFTLTPQEALGASARRASCTPMGRGSLWTLASLLCRTTPPMSLPRCHTSPLLMRLGTTLVPLWVLWCETLTFASTCFFLTKLCNISYTALSQVSLPSPLYLSTVLQHDSGIECTPGESKLQDKKEKGNYIMYARATSGDKLNNNKFSICSVRNISAVLLKKRDDCFVGKFSPMKLFVPCLCM